MRTIGTLTIEHNPALVSLHGLDGVTAVTTVGSNVRDFRNTISNNLAFPQCEADLIRQRLRVGAIDNDITAICTP